MAEGGDAAAEEWLWLLGAGSAGLQRHPASRAAPPARPGRASWAGANGRPGERTRSPTASGAESCAGPQRCLTGTGPHGNRNTRPGATNQEPGTWEPRDRNNGAGTEASGTVLLRNSMMSDWDRTIREQEPPIRSHKSGTWEPRDRNTGAGTEVSGTAWQAAGDQAELISTGDHDGVPESQKSSSIDRTGGTGSDRCLGRGIRAIRTPFQFSKCQNLCENLPGHEGQRP
ncbi:uncharacterized protein LOC125643174 isoform X4 [Caretta caretta]|uniref:uncharacterized protein LOC125643174 isoform X4 n=1 Tax=Caretta caretta TaxID=8467 RepID=UPI003F4B5FBE